MDHLNGLNFPEILEGRKMTKEEFLNRFESENLNISEYIIVTEGITDESLVLGCAFDEENWKVYKTRERGGHYILKEFDNENEAFDYFYEVILIEHNRNMKRKFQQ